MKKNIRNYLKLFGATFSLSALTFGGGYVIVPLMKKKFVDQLGWVNEAEMLDIAAIAQSSPGGIAVNAAILLGWNILGPAGALVSILGTILPPMLILAVVSHFYTAFRSNVWISALLKGMMAGVCAIIFDVVIHLGGTIIKAGKRLPILIMGVAFLLYYIFHINIFFIILFSGLLGALVALLDAHTGKEHF